MRISLFSSLWGRSLIAGLMRCTVVAALLVANMAVVARSRASEISTSWTIPNIVVDEADRPVSPNVFGTIALPVRARPTSTRWARIMTAPLYEPALISLMASARYLVQKDQVAFVQQVVNRAVSDRRQSYDCSDDGYWAAADETLARGMGDCFDIAVAKMEALRLLGIPEKDLYLTTGYIRTGVDAGKRRESAALLVHLSDSFWLLAEHTDQAVEAASSADTFERFDPVVTYGVGATWVHGRLLKPALRDN